MLTGSLSAGFSERVGTVQAAVSDEAAAFHQDVPTNAKSPRRTEFRLCKAPRYSVTTTALEALNIFPNPASASVLVRGLGAITGSKTITLHSMTGAVISRQTSENGDARISTAELPAGTYMLNVQTILGTASFRIAK
jgi:hypothetical protein